VPSVLVSLASTLIDRRMLVVSFASFWMVSVLVSFVRGCLQFKSLSDCFNLIIVCWFSFHRFTRNPFQVLFPFDQPTIVFIVGIWITRCFSPMPFAFDRHVVQLLT
jgi:hypothetical protein